jgi:hypothetical protein
MKRSIAVVATAALLLALVVLSQHATAQAPPSPQARFAVGIVRTDASGFTAVKFVKHSGVCRNLNLNLNTGTPPGGVAGDCLYPLPAGFGRADTVTVEGVAPIAGTTYQPFQHMSDGWTEAGFRLRIRNPNGSVLANQIVRVTFRATADPGGYCDANICS